MPPAKDKENVAGVRMSIVAMVPLSCTIGYCAQHERPLIGGAAVVLLALDYMCFWRFARLEVGDQGMLPTQTLIHLAFSFSMSTLFGFPWAFTYQLEASTNTSWVWQLLGALQVLTLACTLLFLGARTAPFVGAAACLLKGFSPMIWPEGETPAHSTWTAFIVAATFLPLGSLKYRFEQCSLALMPLGIATSIRAGADIGVSSLAIPWGLLSLLLPYIQILWMRRRRVLPPSLRGCKFVTLAHLRKAASTHQGIQRCQDLPQEAFGDPRKARFLIVVSHRWMDRFTCDQVTDECPEGLRLRTLLDKLNDLFSTKGIGKGSSWREKFERFQYAMTGGSDVIIFLDFMCLPQECRSEDGTVVPRTQEETKVFQQCLPSMGTLYSMFPVMVCSEVYTGCTAYLESGWCFSESSTAWLGQQLAYFPSNHGLSEWYNQHIPDQADPQVLEKDLDDILETKAFLFENDRFIARTMIGGFVLKRRLISSLRNKSSEELQIVLEDIAEGGFISLLDQPIDAALNTPLHCAVAMNFPMGVQHLMEAGADCRLLNIFGDSPAQRYMFPRWTAAARCCRRLKALGGRASARSDEDTFRKLADRYTMTSESAATGHSNAQASTIDSSKHSLRDSFYEEGCNNDVIQSFDPNTATVVARPLTKVSLDPVDVKVLSIGLGKESAVTDSQHMSITPSVAN